ncbi:MAG: hypothetical protein WD795_04175 [Woeseia sp.]
MPIAMPIATPVARPAKLLVCLLPFMFAACSGSPDEEAALTSGEGVLRYVPADTPYVFAATQPLPDDVREKLAPHVEAIVQSYSSMMQTAVNEEPTDGSASRMDEETRKRVSTTIAQLAGMITADGIPEAGIDRDSTGAFYGVGLLPVLRITLSDGHLFEATMTKLESEAGEKMSVATVDGHSYRYAGDDEGRLIVAAIDDQLVLGFVPADLSEGLLKSVLGIDLPAKNIADSGDLVALAKKYGFQSYGLGMIDVERVAATFLDDQAGVNGELLAMMDYDASSLSDVCKTEIRAVASIAPRVVAGYTDVTANHIKSNTTVELRSDIASGFQGLTAPVPGLGAEQGGLMSFGMSLNLLAAREFYSARLDAMEADPYECELFAELQAGVAKGREVLNQPIPPIVYGFSGFLAVIDDIKGMDIAKQQPPTDVDMRILLATDSADGLLAMGAMFSPEIASLNLKPDSKPVKLAVPAVASMVEAAYVARSETALALSVGAGSESGLEAMLGAAPREPSPFFSIDMDAARYYGFLGDAMTLTDADKQSPEVVKAQAEVMQTFEKMFSKISFDVLFTERGIEMPSTLEFAK